MNVIAMHENSPSPPPPVLFLKCTKKYFFHQDLTKGASTSNLECDKSQTASFPPHNSAANFAESVFVIDNYSQASIDWQTK